MFVPGQMVRVIDPEESMFGQVGEVGYYEIGFIGVMFPSNFIEYEYHPEQLELQAYTVKTISGTKPWKK